MRGLPLNLAARPVEQMRRARRTARRLLAALLAVSLAQATALAWLTAPAPAEQTEVAPAIAAATLARWRAEVARLTEVADVQRARAAAQAVQLGRELVAWRTIPWGTIFSDLEAALPEGVRLESLQPAVDANGSVGVQLVAAAHDVGPLQNLMMALEAQPAFADVLPQQESAGSDGLVRITLAARYRGGAR